MITSRVWPKGATLAAKADDMSESADRDVPWRRPVLSHEMLLTFPFRASLLENDLAHGVAKLLESSEWTHWLSELTEDAVKDDDARARLNSRLDASRDFLESARETLFRELAVPIFDGISSPKDVQIIITQIEERIRKLRDGHFGSSALRLRHRGPPVGMNLVAVVGGKRYQAKIDYVDVCVFPDANATIVVRVEGLRHEDGSSLNTFEIGSLVRRLKRIQFRARTRVQTPKFVADGVEYDWVSILSPLIALWAGSFADVVATSSTGAFRVLSVASIERDPALHVVQTAGPFESLRERLHFELATGHDTTDTQELPSAERTLEIRTTAMVRQWEAFDALIFWDDSTFLVEDRTESIDPPKGGGVDSYAKEEFPRKVRDGYLWLMIVTNYQESKLLEFVQRLSELAQERQSSLAKPLAVADEYVRFRNLYWHRAITPSQSGKAIHAALVRMLGLDDLGSAVGEQLEQAKAHYESEISYLAEESQRRTRFVLAAIGLIGIPVGIVATILQPLLSGAQPIAALGPCGAWLALGIATLVLSLIAGIVWLLSGREEREREDAREAKRRPT